MDTEDDDCEDDSSSVADRQAIERNVEDLNVNPSKKTEREQQKSKKNVKNSKDLEQIEIIKESQEEIKAKKQKKKEQSEFNLEKPFRSTLAKELKELVPILRHRAKHEIKNVIFKYQIKKMNYETVNFSLNIHKNVQSQFNTHRIDTMCSPFNSLPTQHQTPVPSPTSQDPILHSTPFTINHDKTSSNYQHSFQQEYSFLQKQVPGVENASRNRERTN